MKKIIEHIKLLDLLAKEPLNSHQPVKAYLRYFGWQILKRSGLNLRYRFFEDCRIRVKNKFSNSSACAYVGLPEFSCKAFLLHFLREGDMFVDAGANIGLYSILAAKCCGAKVLAFEPEPSAFRELQNNVSLNDISDLVTCHQIALGGEAYQLKITTNYGVQNHLRFPDDETEPGVVVDVRPLDDFCEKEKPVLLKIDVEGFESEVVYGSLMTIAQPEVKVIILERMGLGRRYEFDEDELHTNLLKLDFECYSYLPFERRLEPVKKTTVGNYFYIRDLPYVMDRLQNAQRYRCRGKEF